MPRSIPPPLRECLAEAIADKVHRALNGPGEDRAARLFYKHIGIVLYACPCRYGGVEWYDDQPPPCPIIGGADTGEVVREQDKCVGLFHRLRLLEFFFNYKAVCTGKLL